MACNKHDEILKELKNIKGTLTLLAAKMGVINTGIDDAESLKRWSQEQDRYMANLHRIDTNVTSK